ncbi:ApaLI family restriction endonuclease [Sphingomonas sp. UV9]|uniref:ApaLI family restriction endonuclease n=1 Tax=Sphingomonas sp. UV9 TaxID=1851410 RepID=UPI000FFB6AF7|nr:ApaLI family restriction endonuclease [Sphingomonas sp. UV9]RXD02523.1 ApaLI family restriction endonuclease [Sphingomonas sp. UV9]
MAKSRDGRLTLEQSSSLTQLRTMGMATAIPVRLDDTELVKLASVILRDIGFDESILPITVPDDYTSYYNLSLDWFSEAGTEDFVPVYLFCLNNVTDFSTYFKCLVQIHKRRRKFSLILTKQPLPKMIQVAPRALLEFGILNSNALASWMIWRKWFYDIDNRSAQETGYLFEPILASVLGGCSYGSRNSPVRRRNDRSKGRQVDCVVDDLAYEFKLRVTIAASGQGRFGEELDFAEDCQASGYKPVLLVLDPTTSHRLTDLSAAFADVGGEAYIGDDAWAYLEDQAGPTMATFVEKYVRTPIAEVDQFSSELLNLKIERTEEAPEFKLTLFDKSCHHTLPIHRSEDQSLSSDDDQIAADAPSP